MDTQRETVGQVNATVLALSGTVDRLNEAAGAVGALDGRLDTLTGIVAPLVPCILELRWRPWRDYYPVPSGGRSVRSAQLRRFMTSPAQVRPRERRGIPTTAPSRLPRVRPTGGGAHLDDWEQGADDTNCPK